MKNEQPIEILNGIWQDLAPHVEREALFVISQDLDLTDVANKVARDDAEAVNAWIESKKIDRPSLHQLQVWNQNKEFRFAIVQPYVLVQELSH